jgi:predicted transcriptional regulator
MPERTYSFTIDDDLHKMLKKIAKRERRTINNTVAVLLENHLRSEQEKEKQNKAGLER